MLLKMHSYLQGEGKKTHTHKKSHMGHQSMLPKSEGQSLSLPLELMPCPAASQAYLTPTGSAEAAPPSTQAYLLSPARHQSLGAEGTLGSCADILNISLPLHTATAYEVAQGAPEAFCNSAHMTLEQLPRSLTFLHTTL